MIAANLLATGMFFDIAVRDVKMAIAAYALATLTAGSGPEVLRILRSIGPTETLGSASAGCPAVLR